MIRRNNNSNDHESVSSDKAPTIKKRMIFTIILLAIILLITVIYISLYAQVSSRNFKIEQLKEEKRQLESYHAKIELEIARNRSVKRIEEVAMNELEMERPDDVEYIAVNDKEQQRADKLEEKEEETTLSDYLVKPINWLQNLTTVEAGDFD